MRRLLGLSALAAAASGAVALAAARRSARLEREAWRSSPAALFARLRRAELIASEGCEP